ncbi:hypothetical protein MMC06_002895 [Schaereria dolodes]|nr:hypothetical protein [Schaereria dolodes]
MKPTGILSSLSLPFLPLIFSPVLGFPIDRDRNLPALVPVTTTTTAAAVSSFLVPAPLEDRRVIFPPHRPYPPPRPKRPSHPPAIPTPTTNHAAVLARAHGAKITGVPQPGKPVPGIPSDGQLSWGFATTSTTTPLPASISTASSLPTTTTTTTTTLHRRNDFLEYWKHGGIFGDIVHWIQDKIAQHKAATAAKKAQHEADKHNERMKEKGRHFYQFKDKEGNPLDEEGKPVKGHDY